MSPNRSFKIYLFTITLGLLAVFVFGLLWLLLGSNANPEGLGWFIFAFIAGLSMIVLPCTLPLAFVIVPLSMGKGLQKGVGIALSFGLGVAITLSLYGIAAALVGQAAIGSLGAPLEVVKNWVYFIAGIFAYLFALGEIGLLKFHMPTYSGAAPAFIQKQGDFLKAFLLGMFLGNVGVGCPHPATPLILIEIASSGNVFYGWTLFFTHAIGRVLPLLVLAFLGVMGVNGLQWIVARKDRVERATGVAMVFVAGFILTLGLFSHDWWVNSGIHTQLEKLTQEETLLEVLRGNLNSTVTHSHGIATGTGLFGLPLWLGSPFMIVLWLIPLWWMWLKRRRQIEEIPEANQIPEREARRDTHFANEKGLVALGIILILVFIYYLPHQFLKHDALLVHSHASGDEHAGMTESEMQAHMMTEHSLEAGDDSHVMVDGSTMAGHEHASVYKEAGEITEGVTVRMTATQNKASNLTLLVPTTLRFTVIDAGSGQPIDDLELSHEKYIHVIGIRSDLNEFFHLHPKKVSTGVWEVEHTFAKAGSYKIYTDIVRAGVHLSIGHPTIAISGFKEPENSEQIAFAKNVVLGNYQVAIQYSEPLLAGSLTDIHFVVKDLYGLSVPLDNFLGVAMHLALFKQGNPSIYLHTHPDDHETDSMSGDTHTHSSLELFKSFTVTPIAYAHGGAADENTDPALKVGTVVPFDITFPEPGIYKLFAQFRPQGETFTSDDEAMVASFYLPVFAAPSGDTPKGVPHVHADGTIEYHVVAAAPLPKPLMILVSLALMSLLSYGVWKFLAVRQ